jgi:hypothetical protein
MEISGAKVSSAICGDVSRIATVPPVMAGPRTFVSGINKGVGVHLYSVSGDTNAMNNKFVELNLNRRITSSDIAVELVFTAYTGLFFKRLDRYKLRSLTP